MEKNTLLNMKKRLNKKAEKKHLKSGKTIISNKVNPVKLKWDRKSQQHELFLEQGRMQREKIHTQIKIAINEIIELIQLYDRLSILANISLTALHNLSPNSPLSAFEKDQSHLEATMEYLQSLILAFPNEKGLPIAPIEFYSFIIEKVRNLIIKFSAYFSLEASTQNIDKDEFKLRHDAISNSLYIRGNGYEIHINEIFLELFGNHDNAFEAHFGFSCHHIMQIFDLIEDNISATMNHWDILKVKFFTWRKENPKEILLKKYSIEELDLLGPLKIYEKESNSSIELPNPFSPFKISWLEQELQNVAKILSLKYGENSAFIANEKFKAEPLSDTLIYEMPFIEDLGNYYCFNPFLGPRNYFTIAEELLKRIPNNYYNNKFLSNKHPGGRDKYLEDKVFETFKVIFPEFQFYLNSNYTFKEDELNLKCTKSEDGNYEIDIIGTGEDVIFLIEVKAASLSKKAKRGSVEKIVTGLKSIIGNASCQAYRAEQFILKTEIPSFYNGKINYKVNSKNRIHKIIISYEHLSSLATRLNSLKVLNIIENKIDFPWVISLFDLLIFRDLISGKELLEYLDWRLPLYEKAQFEYFDEITLLGFWLSNSVKEVPHFDQLILDSDFSFEIDSYFNSLSTDNPLPKPKKMR